MVVLGFVDYTKNAHIQKTINKALLYGPDMVLYVKTWDSIAKQALDLEEGSFYCLENLKVELGIKKIGATLSDHPLSKITKITDQTIINEINSRSNKLEVEVITFNEQIHNDTELVVFNQIKTPGYYKLQVKIIRHHPYNGHYICVCAVCKIAQEKSKFNCDCGEEPEEFFLVKFLVKDASGEFVLISKNEIARNMLKICNLNKSIELLVKCDFYKKNYMRE